MRASCLWVIAQNDVSRMEAVFPQGIYLIFNRRLHATQMHLNHD